MRKEGKTVMFFSRPGIDHEEILREIELARLSNKDILIVANGIKGTGVSPTLSAADYNELSRIMEIQKEPKVFKITAPPIHHVFQPPPTRAERRKAERNKKKRK
jgi:hypothetical protein